MRTLLFSILIINLLSPAFLWGEDPKDPVEFRIIKKDGTILVALPWVSTREGEVTGLVINKNDQSVSGISTINESSLKPRDTKLSAAEDIAIQRTMKELLRIKHVRIPEGTTQPSFEKYDYFEFKVRKDDQGRYWLGAAPKIMDMDPNELVKDATPDAPCRLYTEKELEKDQIRLEALAYLDTVIADIQREIDEETISKIGRFYEEFQKKYCDDEDKRLDRFMYLLGGNVALSNADKSDLDRFPIKLTEYEREIVAFGGALHGEAGGLYQYPSELSRDEKNFWRQESMGWVGKLILYRKYERERRIRIIKKSLYFNDASIRWVVTERAQFSPMDRRKLSAHRRMICDTSAGEEEARKVALRAAIETEREYRDKKETLPKLNMFCSPKAYYGTEESLKRLMEKYKTNWIYRKPYIPPFNLSDPGDRRDYDLLRDLLEKRVNGNPIIEEIPPWVFASTVKRFENELDPRMFSFYYEEE